MHQDMQNFLQVMAIDTSKKLRVLVQLKTHRSPQFNFSVNGIECLSSISTFEFDLLDSIVFEYRGIRDNSAVEIIDITINDCKIMPKYLHLANPPTHWLENIDSWNLKIPSPFYTWYQYISGQGDIY